MKNYCLNIEKDNHPILRHVIPADTFLSRFAGLMMKKDLGGAGGLYISPCNQIHTFMMRFDIDAIFLSQKGDILHILSAMKPGRVSPRVRGAVGVLETSPGFAKREGLAVGDRLDFVKGAL